MKLFSRATYDMLLAMPVRNTVRIESPHTYFHVYNRGVERRRIFMDSEDYAKFLEIVARYLSSDVQKNKRKNDYLHLRPFLDLNAYCLMPNHFHMLVYVKDDYSALSKLMACIITAYIAYFNKRHKRRGPLFEARYKASPIFNESYLQHISRYIHLNPRDFRRWEYSSYKAYLRITMTPDWLAPNSVLDLFDNLDQY